ncbi:MAG: amidohydrolase [Proteobacteria bacterium]|nr:amidohydrolase [Pseudomonadota bacterium]
MTLAFMLTFTATVACAQPAVDTTPADLILTNAHIKSPSGWAGSVAVRRGIIVAMGDDAAVMPLRGPATQVVDLHSNVVLPGFSDVHVHPLGAGLSELQCKIAQGSSLAATQATVKKCAGQLQSSADWVVGGQWDVPALGRAPDRKALDSVASGHPIILDDTSGHSAWVNTRALEIAGITRSTVDPPGGIIERDKRGEPTGILRESATDLVRRHVPKLSDDTLRKALTWSLKQMLQVGITSYTEAAVGYAAGAERELQTYAAMADAGQIKQRATLCITWAPGDAEGERAITMRNLFARDRVSPSCVKIFLDGVPTDSHTAAMLRPYAQKMRDRNDEAAVRGMLLVDQKVLNEAVTRFDRMGLTVKFHAAGDAAVRAGLNAIQAARAANGFSGLMHNVGHCTFVAKEDLARARAIGATFEVSPYLWSPSPINDSITEAVGDDLIKRVWPVREMIDSGALVVPGSDWAVVPSVNPWLAIEALVTRELPGGSAKSFGKAEAITLPEAIDLFTVNSARQERMSNVVGQLGPGMAADLVVVDQNPYEVPAVRLHDTHVKMTFIAGEKVFDSAAP